MSALSHLLQKKKTCPGSTCYASRLISSSLWNDVGWLIAILFKAELSGPQDLQIGEHEVVSSCRAWKACRVLWCTEMNCTVLCAVPCRVALYSPQRNFLGMATGCPPQLLLALCWLFWKHLVDFYLFLPFLLETLISQKKNPASRTTLSMSQHKDHAVINWQISQSILGFDWKRHSWVFAHCSVPLHLTCLIKHRDLSRGSVLNLLQFANLTRLSLLQYHKFRYRSMIVVDHCIIGTAPFETACSDTLPSSRFESDHCRVYRAHAMKCCC